MIVPHGRVFSILRICSAFSTHHCFRREYFCYKNGLGVGTRLAVVGNFQRKTQYQENDANLPHFAHIPTLPCDPCGVQSVAELAVAKDELEMSKNRQQSSSSRKYGLIF